MEDTLRARFPLLNGSLEGVLILVLMEDTLRDFLAYLESKREAVLILVLMEDTLRDTIKRVCKRTSVSLNPCFNGRYSQSSEG